MLASMRASASAMRAQQLAVDVLANNVANVNTIGFRRSRVEFQDLPPRFMVEQAEEMGLPELANLQVGAGVEVQAIPKLFDQGELMSTGSPLDLAVDGDGFFMVQLGDGTTAYTRNGSIKVDSEGSLVTASGLRLQPEVKAPVGTAEVRVQKDGGVWAVSGDGQVSLVGELQLARFANPAGLFAVGQSLFVATEASGAAQATVPGENGAGGIVSGALEMSNVDMAEEVTNMLMAQRAYSMSAKSLQTVDEMLAMANSLRR